MTDLDVALTPAQWEHWARHGWTLTAAPTEPCRTSSCNVPELGDTCAECHPSGVIPVPVTEPCPVCRGSRIDYAVTADGYVSFTCGHCSGSGVVPRTVGIIRPEQVCPACGGMRDVAAADEPNPMPCARCKGLGHFPAERVGTATVTPVPVVDVNGPWPQNEGAQFVTVGDGLVMLYTADRDADEGYDGEDLSGYGPTDPPLFATPPNPGTTVWRLDKENNDG